LEEKRVEGIRGDELAVNVYLPYFFDELRKGRSI